MKVCNMCGNNVNDNENFCPVCGNNLAGYQQPANNNMHYNHQNPAYGNPPIVNQQPMNQGYNQQYGQPMMNQYYQPISNNKSTGGQVFGAIISSIGLFMSLSTMLTVLTGFDEYYTKQILDPKFAEYAGNTEFWAASVAIFPVTLGLIALIMGIIGKKKYNKGIDKFNLISGIACLAIAVINVIGVINYFK